MLSSIVLAFSIKSVWTLLSNTYERPRPVGKFPFTWKRTLNLCSEEERVCASVIKHYRNTYSLCQSEMDAMTSLISHVHILYIFMVWLYCTVVMLQVFILVSELSLHCIISIFYCSTLFKVSFFKKFKRVRCLSLKSYGRFLFIGHSVERIEWLCMFWHVEKALIILVPLAQVSLC